MVFAGCPPPEPGFTIIVTNHCFGGKVISLVAQKVENMSVVPASDELLTRVVRFPRQRSIFVPFSATTGTPTGVVVVIAPSNTGGMVATQSFTVTGDALQDGDTIQLEFTGDIDNPLLSSEVN